MGLGGIMKILVTGSLGFVGRETVKYIKDESHDVDLRIVDYDLLSGNDIRDKYTLKEAMSLDGRVDRVLHLAAIARFADADRDPKLAFETNVLGTKNVAEACKELSIPLVYASTGSVYMPINGEPPITEDFRACGNSVYGCTKYMGELYVREHNPHIILRYAHLYGAEKHSGGLVDNFLSRIKRGLAPILYGGKQSNAFTYIKDIARANMLALTAPWGVWNNTYNISSDEELSVEKAAEVICEVFGYKAGVEIGEERPVDAKRFILDTSKAKQLLGFEAEYTFKQGINDMKELL
jgi:UDP-glucose 4-epimerase